jgi:hypothetical protein
VFEVLLPDGDKLWDPALRRIYAALRDDALVDLIVAALSRRYLLNPRRGRLGTPAEMVLRMLVLKHLYQWSFDECEREVGRSLVYRAFCRIDCERVPDARTLIRLAHLIDPTLPAERLRRLEDHLLRGHGDVLEHRRERRRHVHGPSSALMPLLERLGAAEGDQYHTAPKGRV